MYVNRNNMLSQWVDHSQIVFRLQEIMIYIWRCVVICLSYYWDRISAQGIHVSYYDFERIDCKYFQKSFYEDITRKRSRKETKTLYHSKSYNHFSGNAKLDLLVPFVCGIIEAQLSSCNLMLLRRKRSRKETKWYQKPFSEDKDFDKWRLIIIFILKFNFVSVGVYYVK